MRSQVLNFAQKNGTQSRTHSFAHSAYNSIHLAFFCIRKTMHEQFESKKKTFEQKAIVYIYSKAKTRRKYASRVHTKIGFVRFTV